ncbi:hypothetical protein B0A48_18497 [Cryoendolithus antarcticus]|uniref:3'-5' exonuclease domain-containing protein n=1 Tax=Cryoendolithus antarcticus TaxID=1507870 RepID=A0A1V8S8W9_9PEZI|nr:hypothetical protein B0A48_18497 [Cryoendolithus antarcticus]
MAANDLDEVQRNLGKLTLAGDVSQSLRPRTQPKWVDSPDAVSSLIDILSSVEAGSASISLDLEGLNLSRNGSISIVQIWIPFLEQAFLLDVHTLGRQAFSVVNREGKTIKSILESDRLNKYLFDVRNDADALYALFDVQLAGVTDVQLLELATRRGPKHVLCGLAACIEEERVIPSLAVLEWKSTKLQVVEMLKAKCSGSCDVFNTRPLSQLLINYCVGDVQFLPALSDVYKKRLNKYWSEEVQVETVQRLEQSRSLNYIPQGKHKIFGPKKWRFPPKRKVNPAATTSASTTHNKGSVTGLPDPAQIEVRDTFPQVLLFAKYRQASGNGLWKRPVSFVPDGGKDRRQSSTKRALATSSSTLSASHGFLIEDHALCDKDCGWCGHCADNIL